VRALILIPCSCLVFALLNNRKIFHALLNPLLQMIFSICWVVQVFLKLEFILTHFQLLHELLLPRLCNLIRHLQIKMICTENEKTYIHPGKKKKKKTYVGVFLKINISFAIYETLTFILFISFETNG
jgi:hypothetical protein